MTKKRGLGRGLGALLEGAQLAVDIQTFQEEPVIFDTPPLGDIESDGYQKELPVEFLQPGKFQPRKDMAQDSLEELAASIRQQGVMQPIVVRVIGKDRYEIIAGERRWRAAQLATLEKIPVIVRNVSDETAIAMALIENIQREDLNPMEEAVALRRLKDEFDLTQQEVADAVGKSRTTVTNLLRLMTLKSEVKKFLEHGDIEMGHARALLGLTDGYQQLEAANIIVSKGLSVRQTEALVRKMLQDKQVDSNNSTQKKNPDTINLEETLSKKVGAIISIRHTAKGKGKLVINYNSLDELDGILEHIV